jgi:hypothetical protein
MTKTWWEAPMVGSVLKELPMVAMFVNGSGQNEHV